MGPGFDVTCDGGPLTAAARALCSRRAPGVSPCARDLLERAVTATCVPLRMVTKHTRSWYFGYMRYAAPARTEPHASSLAFRQA
jgi:hypothetical protein